jgi:hypothetical protein
LGGSGGEGEEVAELREKRWRRARRNSHNGDAKARRVHGGATQLNVACGPPACGRPDEAGKSRECKWH